MVAYEFLKHLDPTTNVFCFQAFPEASSTALALLKHGRLQDLEETLRQLNAEGCGIAVCINETDGRGRKAENITRVRAVWHDDDTGAATDFPLAPSLVVETSPGRYHRYWFVEGFWPADESGRSTFEAIMRSMVRFGADKQATDLSRVLRLPGFDHLKAKPYRVTIRDISGIRYTREQLVSQFTAEPSGLWHRDRTRYANQISPAYKIDDNSGQITEILPHVVPVEAPLSVPDPQDEEDADTDRPDIERISQALEHIPAEDRDHWLVVGMALHHEMSGSEDGFALWDGWSQGTTADNYDLKEQRRAWESFRDDHPDPTTIATMFSLAKHNGWRDSVVLQPLANVPQVQLDIPRRDDDLVLRTMIDVRNEFAANGHYPSDQQYAGLEQVAVTIQGMAKRHPSLARNIHLSFLPPGVGKTTTAAHAVQNLVQMEEYNATSVIFFLFRVEEIAKLAEAMNLSEHDFAVIVSENYEEGKLGNPDKTKARVLFTTQQMLLSRLRQHTKFADIADFRCNGSPRQVRIWDEAISPALPMTVNQYQIAELVSKAAHEGGPNFADLLQQTGERLRQAADRAIIGIPDIAEAGIPLETMRSWYDDASAKGYCETLFGLSGHKVRVRKDIGNAAVHYKALLPDDLGPMLVLDASGHFRKVYEFWHQSRGDLVALPSPQKNYTGLTIHHWDRGAGHQARKNEGGELVDSIVKAIHEIPTNESALVIHHIRKSRTEPDWQQDIRSKLKRENVYFCNWGRHTATNDYHRCQHVILAGVLQYATSQCEALARGAKALEADQELSAEDVRAVHISEMAHHIFQAACRISIRQSVRDGCPPGCHLYVIGSSHSQAGVSSDLLARIFPGATISEWLPVIRLSGLTKQLYELLVRCDDEQPIEKWDICNNLGIRYLSQLNKLLKRHDLHAALEADGAQIEVIQKNVTIRPQRVRYDKQGVERLYPF